VVVQVNKHDVCPAEAQAYEVAPTGPKVHHRVLSEAVNGIGVLDAMMACVMAIRDSDAAARSTPTPDWVPFRRER